MKKFSSFLKEQSPTVYFTFGRMNPPTIGHEMLLDSIAEMARGSAYRVYLSQSHDSEKNPLLYEDKVKICRKVFPSHARSIRFDPSVKTFLEAASALYDDGFRNVVFVGGSDRTEEIRGVLEKYNGVRARFGYYRFDNISCRSVGTRDPDSAGVSGVSATKLREAASTGDYASFSSGMPASVSDDLCKLTYNKVRTGMGLVETKTFKPKVPKRLSDIREKYISGSLFSKGDRVLIKESREQGTISHLGSNYIIVETAGGERRRKWLSDVEKI